MAFNYITGQYDDEGLVQSVPAVTDSTTFNWGALSNITGNLVSSYANIEAAKIKASQPIYSRGINGQLYREGIPVGAVATNGGISPLMLLLIVGGMIFALKN